MDGQFIWYELLARDAAAAATFYGAVMGWTASAFDGDTPGSYRLFAANGVDVAGFMTLPEDAAGMTPGWRGYVGVADVDAVAAQAKKLGGTVIVPPQDIPNVGRFALLADPQGADFYVMRGDGPPSRAFEPTSIGHGAWAELHTKGWEQAFDFYAALLGWRVADRMDMGPMGTYAMIDTSTPAVRDGPCTASGAMFDSPDPSPPHWLFYFTTDDIDAAKARIEAAGGTVVHGPQQIPGDAWIVMAVDPQGAGFALVGPRS